MWCGVQQVAGNVLWRSAAAREFDGECGAVFSGWPGIVARRPATGRECGRETGAASSGWPGLWREMRRGVQRLAGKREMWRGVQRLAQRRMEEQECRL